MSRVFIIGRGYAVTLIRMLRDGQTTYVCEPCVLVEVNEADGLGLLME